jgi:SAM-dependent methyltransferase
MQNSKDYLALNKAAWNKKVESHYKSEFYDLQSFFDGKTSLQEIELGLLGDIKDKTILHLQCHFGQDSLSLARMGAKVTGVDISDIAIQKATELNNSLGMDAEFLCSDLYSLPDYLNQTFDLVFTSYGTIGWLPDLNKWASVVSRFLKPGGRFIFVEFHPVVWMFDNDFKEVAYTYFKSDPIIETQTGTYADRTANIEYTEISWNHGLSEVIGALLSNGLNLIDFQEYNYSPYNCFLHSKEVEAGKYRIEHFGEKIPMVYTLVMNKG